MNDIVERLREGCGCNYPETTCMAESECRDAFEAANTIIRLTAEVERLRAALEFYANPENWVSVWDHQFKMMAQEPVYRDEGNKARAALSGEKQ